MEPRKDLENEHPVPIEWRRTFDEIVDRFIDGDYALERGVEHVKTIPDDTARHIADYIEDYGEVLVPLTERSWQYSVVQWQGDYWEALVNLCTQSEGISDLVIHAFIKELSGEYVFEIHLVYVP